MSHKPNTPTTLHTTTLAEQQHTGFLVALWLQPETAAALALPDGESVDDLHVTLCYVADAEGLGDLAVARAIAAIEREVWWQSSLTGKVGGYGRFLASDTSDAMDVFFATVDVPGLIDLRSVVTSALAEAGCFPSTSHGYTPHITLAYLVPDNDNPVDRLPDTGLKFDAVTIMVGDRRIDIPLATSIAFGEPSTRRPDRGIGKDGCQFHDFRRAVTLTGADEWVQFLPVPGTYHHVLYGDLELTADKYGLMVSNFASSLYGQTLPINCEHDMPASGAVGYIADMRIAADGSIEVKPEWNERGTALLEGDRFRYVSAEFFDSWQDPVSGEWHNDVAFGMAICTNPHFKETVLRPLAASEARPVVQVAPANSREGDAGMGNPNNTSSDDKPTTITLSEEEVTRLREADTRLTAAEHRAESAEGQVRDLTDRVASMERDARRQRFSDMVAGRGGANDGSVWFGDPAKHVALLETLSDLAGEDSDEVSSYVEQQRGIADQLKGSVIFTEIGTTQTGEANTDAKIDALVKDLREKSPVLSKEQAEAQVYREHPDLYAEAMNGK